MATFIETFEPHGSGVRIGVKDLIDMVGVPTTAGCRALAHRARPATTDAECLAGIRQAEAEGTATIVGKTNLHELAAGATGINPWYGTPRNPLDPALIPGGSSSGSAVAVAAGDADVALGSDTGGSVRIPSACCGTAGLKTTWGRVSLRGVWPLSPRLDTIGPMARDVAGLITGMELLEPGFQVAPTTPQRIGRLRIDADPVIDEAIDQLLATTELEVVDVAMPDFPAFCEAGLERTFRDAWIYDRQLFETDFEGLGSDLQAALAAASNLGKEDPAQFATVRRRWQDQWRELFQRVDVVALPTLVGFPPAVDTSVDIHTLVDATMPINVAGLPSLALPVPTGGRLPASVQLVGPDNAEESLLALGAVVEAAAATLRLPG